MRDKDLMKQFRIQVFEDWEAGRFETVTALCEHYQMSRTWFYKWKSRWKQDGPEGMMSRKDGPDEVPHAVNEAVLGRLMEYVEENPSHGCDRIADELDESISARTIQRYLNRWDLGTIDQRQLFQRCQNGQILTDREQSALTSDRRKSKQRHVEVSYPGELVGMDLLYVFSGGLLTFIL